MFVTAVTQREAPPPTARAACWPQNLAIGAASVGWAGREGDIFRKVIGWSVVLLLAMAVLVLLQSGPLSFMVP